VADPANRKFDLIAIGSGLAGIAALTATDPQHPYARLTVNIIREALGEFLAILEGGGIPTGTLARSPDRLKRTERHCEANHGWRLMLRN